MKRTFTFSLTVILLLAGISCTHSQSKSETSGAPLDVKIGQMLNIGFRGMAISDTSHIARDISRYHLGGVVLFDYDVPKGEYNRNIESPEQLKKLVRQLKSLSDIPLIVAIDQEGGKVARLKPKYGFPEIPSADYIGRQNNADTTRFYAGRTARTLTEMGINMNLAPVVDVDLNPDNPIIGGLGRSYSADPQTVTRHARIFIKTMHDYGILTALKHFPGHGSSEKDSHLGVVDVTQSWSKKELIPYRRLIGSGLVDAVMTAHIFNARLDSVYPATLSKPTVSGLLRDSLNYEGVVFSDDLMMGAIRKEYTLQTTIERALRAGVDILSFANNSVYDPEIVPKAHRIIRKLIEDGSISRERIDRSYRRIMELKEPLGNDLSGQ